jgi:hypothetical protein
MSKILKMMLWGLEAGLRRQEVGYTLSEARQHELIISDIKYKYAIDDSLKSLVVGATWKPATAKGLTIDTADTSIEYFKTRIRTRNSIRSR